MTSDSGRDPLSSLSKHDSLLIKQLSDMLSIDQWRHFVTNIEFGEIIPILNVNKRTAYILHLKEGDLRHFFDQEQAIKFKCNNSRLLEL
jgi:hypothetical protein